MNANTALLVIDLQRWFLEVGSPEKLKGVTRLIKKANELIHFFDQKQLPIFKIQTVHQADKSTWNQWAIANDVPRLIEGTTEAEYVPEVKQTSNEIILTKTRLSAFLRTDLEKQLLRMKCQQVVIGGYSTDNCVGQTAIDAYERDFKVILAGEAILGTKKIHEDQMLKALERKFGISPISNSAIQSLLESYERNEHS